MTFEEAKEYSIHQEPSFLPRAKKIGSSYSYVCPCCESGTGPKKTGITMLPKSYEHPVYHCFSCGMTGDIFDLAKKYYGLSNNKDTFQVVYDYFGLNVDGIQDKNYDISKIQAQIKREREIVEEEEVKTDYTQYFRRASRHLDPTYLMNRGISEKTQRHYLIGTDHRWLNPITVERYKKEGKSLRALSSSERCIIPTSRYSYLARDIRPNLSEEQEKYAKQKVGKVPLFNEYYASKMDIIFVPEGEIDAISFNEVTDGEIEACGLGSTSNWSKFVAKCSTGGPFHGKGIVLALDNDEPGKKTSAKMKEALEKKGLIVVELEYEGKDPNKALINNRYGFKKSVLEAIALVKEKMEEKSTTNNRSKEYEDDREM